MEKHFGLNYLIMENEKCCANCLNCVYSDQDNRYLECLIYHNTLTNTWGICDNYESEEDENY